MGRRGGALIPGPFNALLKLRKRDGWGDAQYKITQS